MPNNCRKKRAEFRLKYVHEANGRIVYRPYIKKKHLHSGINVDGGGFLKPPIRIGKPEDEPDVIYANYLIAKEQIKRDEAAIRNSLRWIVEQYEDSYKYKQLAPVSHERNKNLKKILDYPIKLNGKNANLGQINIMDVSKPLFNKIAAKRLREYQEKGFKGTVQINREITFISSAINWAVNNILNLGIDHNPLRGIQKFEEDKNERYVTDKEYEIQFKQAGEYLPYLQPVFELTYLLASRGIETLDIRLSHCTDDGILVKRRKGSKDNIIEWTPRLKLAYKMARELHKNHKITMIDPYLIVGRNGGQLVKSTLNSAMDRLKKKMMAKGIKTYWSLHLLKAKGISDSEDKSIAGHVSEAMKQRYNIKIESIKATK